MSYELVLPFVPKSKNVYEGWLPQWKAGYKRKWEKALDKAIQEAQFPRARRVVCVSTLVFGSRRRRDWQNYVHPFTWYLADALVRNGVIADDTPDQFSVPSDGGIRFDVNNRPYVAKDKRQRTVIGVACEL